MSSVLEMALEALEYHREQTRAIPKSDVAIAALKEAIKNQSEPVGVIETEDNRERRCGPVVWLSNINALPNGTKLYTSTPTIPAGWQQVTHANAPKYGERVIALTTDADGDPIPEFAHYNGELGFLGIGGKRIKPVSYWMPSPTAPKGEQP